jgi:hypothetical protein
MLPKHIKIAREEGFEAGMEAYMSAPISKQHSGYAQIKACRTVGTKTRKYKELFGSTVGVIKTPFNGPEQAQAEIPSALDIQTIVQQAVAAALAAINATQVEAVEAEPVKVARTKRRAKAAGYTLSNEDVWMLLGSNPKFKRIANDFPAVPALLWRANQEGVFERVYTKMDGWVATGRNSKYEPNDKAAACSGRVLYRMNKSGLLRTA